MPGPLAGIRVLDLTRVLAGPYASMLLGDLGAEVIKVEQPRVGDIARGNGPFIGAVSSYFLSLNRGKESITLDISRPEGAELALKLAERCDILLENFVPGTMKRYGLHYEVASARNPRLIYASISGFGQTGPYATRPALDVIIQAIGGIMSITGEEGGPPVRPGASLGDITAGLFACVSVLAALQERATSDRGQYIDISMLDCQAALLENAFARYFATGEVPKPLGTRHPVFTPFQAYHTSDGYIAIALVGTQWPLFCAAIERLDLIDDPRFTDGWQRTRHYNEINPIISDMIRTRTSEEWLKLLGDLEIPCGPVNRIDQLAHDPHVNGRGMFVEVPVPGGEKARVVNCPVKFSRTDTKVEKGCPELGEHTGKVLKDLLGLAEGEIESLEEQRII
ncbi:MAG: CoA transferase [Chloroflexi bacterium]|nr:CoA transferase [Chloroflexota bacterium]